MTLVVVLDYGSGNVHSVTRALATAGVEVVLSADPVLVDTADGLVVPGVGAYSACMDALKSVGGDVAIKNRLSLGKAVLGICVGQQIMFESGIEHGVSAAGLGIWPGTVTQLRADVLPHMGWNTVSADEDSKLFAGLAGQRFYFVHSYAAHYAPGPGTSWTEYGGDRFVAAVEAGPLATTQFHPEKSGAAGLRLLRNWVETL